MHAVISHCHTRPPLLIVASSTRPAIVWWRGLAMQGGCDDGVRICGRAVSSPRFAAARASVGGGMRGSALLSGIGCSAGLGSERRVSPPPLQITEDSICSRPCRGAIVILNIQRNGWTKFHGWLLILKQRRKKNSRSVAANTVRRVPRYKFRNNKYQIKISSCLL